MTFQCPWFDAGETNTKFQFGALRGFGKLMKKRLSNLTNIFIKFNKCIYSYVAINTWQTWGRATECLWYWDLSYTGWKRSTTWWRKERRWSHGPYHSDAGSSTWSLPGYGIAAGVVWTAHSYRAALVWSLLLCFWYVQHELVN